MRTDELVLAIPVRHLFLQGGFQGFASEPGPWLPRLFDPKQTKFLPRAQAERDPDWKQIIPYVVLESGGAVFVYRRGQASTEARLRALHSVGLGGHIRPADESMFEAPGRGAYEAGMRRELGEEVALGAPVIEERLIGLINDDSTEVGRVHVGVVHIWRMAAPQVRARESKIAAGRFAIPETLLGPEGPELESWSRLVLEGWLAAPGLRERPHS